MQLYCLQGNEWNWTSFSKANINETQKYNHDSPHMQDLLDFQKDNKIKGDLLGIWKGRKMKGDKNHDG